MNISKGSMISLFLFEMNTFLLEIRKGRAGFGYEFPYLKKGEIHLNKGRHNMVVCQYKCLHCFFFHLHASVIKGS